MFLGISSSNRSVNKDEDNSIIENDYDDKLTKNINIDSRILTTLSNNEFTSTDKNIINTNSNTTSIEVFI